MLHNRMLHINSYYPLTPLHEELNRALFEHGVVSDYFVPLNPKSASASFSYGKNVYAVSCYSDMDHYLFFHKQRKMYSALKRFSQNTRYGVVHAHSLYTSGALAYRIYKERKIPYIVSVRNTDINQFYKKMIHLRPLVYSILESAGAVIFLSPAYRRNTISILPEKIAAQVDKKAFVVPNGIQNNWLCCRPREQHVFDPSVGIRLIIAGRIDKNKNATTVLSACERLNSMGVKSCLTVVGKQSDMSIVSKLSASPYVTIEPECDAESLRRMLREHDIFVMPSIYESFGLVYAEALSQGLPVIYSKGQGFDGQFSEGEVGYGVNCFDVDDIVRKIIQLSKIKGEMFTQCIDAAQCFSWNDIAKSLLAIYQEFEEGE